MSDTEKIPGTKTVLLQNRPALKISILSLIYLALFMGIVFAIGGARKLLISLEYNEFLAIILSEGVFRLLLILYIGNIIIHKFFAKDSKDGKSYWGTPFLIILIYMPLINILASINGITQGMSANFLMAISSGIIVASSGVIEELLFRGLFLRHLLKVVNVPGLEQRRMVGRTVGMVMVVAGTFALVHLVNLINGTSIAEVLPQVVYAFFFGVLFGFIYVLSNGKLLPCALGHASVNFVGGLGRLNYLIEDLDTTIEVINIEAIFGLNELLTQLVWTTGLFTVPMIIVSYFLYLKLKERNVAQLSFA